MIEGKILENYAELVLKVGVNLQKGQGLCIVCPVTQSKIAHALANKAYEYGAKNVIVQWDDEELSRINFMNADVDTLCDIPQWFVDSREYVVDNNYARIAIIADDPSIFKDVPAEKLSAFNTAKSKKLKKFMKSVMANEVRWCVVAVPFYDWAKQVFPNSSDPVSELSTAIEKTMRLDKPDHLKAWSEHIEKLAKHAKFLNDNNFEYLRFKSNNGTDIKVGLAIDHIWISAEEMAKDGVPFVANLPTEEVFTAPHANKINGVVKSALPLSYNGKIIDDFSLTFKDGKIVDYSAKVGYDTLKGLIETDEGTLSIGEVALIGKNSPIAESGILYYNTLFDENASCHFAIGEAYPSTIKNGTKLSMEELKERGYNESLEHVDFMIGTKDLEIIGITLDGKEVPVFKDGEWVI